MGRVRQTVALPETSGREAVKADVMGCDGGNSILSEPTEGNDIIGGKDSAIR